MLKIILNLFFLSFFFFQIICSRAEITDSILDKNINKAIRFLALNQIKKTDSTNCFEGEWPTYIHNTKFIPLLGPKGKSAYDSNGFNTLFIHNILAEVYLNGLTNENILPVLQLAQRNFAFYKNENTFNFWPLLTAPEHISNKSHLRKYRRANHFSYHSRFINNYANIYDDADDTAAGYLAMYYSNEINKKAGQLVLQSYHKEPLAPVFASYRDVGNRKTNWYNKKTGFNYRTGAYLTWFGPERKNNNFIKWFFPKHDQQNILYGSNEVDCVVNANIIRTLLLTNEVTVPGFGDAEKLILKAFENGSCYTCGVYYPTEFSLHYAVAKAIDAGSQNLSTLKESIVAQIKNACGQHGFWTSQIVDNDIQSTLYAINTLILLAGKNDEEAIKMIEQGIQSLLKVMIDENEILYWKGGVFFSGGSAIRYVHVWRSDAYTTALAIEAMVNYKKIINKS